MPMVNAHDKPAGVLSLRKPLLIFLEGMYDITCIKQFGRLLHADNPALPDLSQGEASGQMLFLPVGGSNLENWAHRLEALGYPEFHLLCGTPHKRCYVAEFVMWRSPVVSHVFEGEN